MSLQIDLHKVFSGPSTISQSGLLSMLLLQSDPSSGLLVSRIRGLTKALRHLWGGIRGRIHHRLLHLHRSPPLQELQLFFCDFKVQAANGAMPGESSATRSSCATSRDAWHLWDSVIAIIECLTCQWILWHLERIFRLGSVWLNRTLGS